MNSDLYTCSSCGDHVSHSTTGGVCEGPKLKQQRAWMPGEIADAHVLRNQFSATTRFVEKSRYDDVTGGYYLEVTRLEKELAAARAENERLMNVEYWPERAKNAEQDRDLLRAENAALIRKCIEWINQIETLSAEIAKLREGK